MNERVRSVLITVALAAIATALFAMTPARTDPPRPAPVAARRPAAALGARTTVAVHDRASSPSR